MSPDDFISTRAGSNYLSDKEDGITQSLDYYLDGYLKFRGLQKTASLFDYWIYELEIDAIKEILTREYANEKVIYASKSRLSS